MISVDRKAFRKKLAPKLSRALDFDISEDKCAKFLEVLRDTVQESLSNDEEVNLIGFGKFEMQKRAARTARNPRTGEAIEIPSKSVPKFKFFDSFTKGIDDK